MRHAAAAMLLLLHEAQAGCEGNCAAPINVTCGSVLVVGDSTTDEYVLDYPFPCEYDVADKRWVFEDGETTWDAVFKRWKSRGPMNEIYVESIQRSRRDVGGWLAGKSQA